MVNRFENYTENMISRNEWGRRLTELVRRNHFHSSFKVLIARGGVKLAC